MSETMLLSAE